MILFFAGYELYMNSFSQNRQTMSTKIDETAKKTYIIVMLQGKKRQFAARGKRAKHMRKAAFAVLCAVLLLSSCGDRRSVEDMLVAPALTADQNAVLAVMERYSEERVVLKYPTSGDRRYPIQFIDLDSDGSVEAVVFFAIPSEGQYARMAVLGRDGDQWEITEVVDGKGTDIRTVRVMYFDVSADRVLMVEWFTANRRGEEVSVYRYADGAIVSNFEDSSTALRVYDFDADGYDEFCYVSAGPGDSFVLKYVDTSEGAFAVVSTIALNADMTACIAVTAGRTADGLNAIYVDESIGDEYQVTEAFVLSYGNLAAVELGDYDITELSRRPVTALSCRKFFGSSTIHIPSAEVPFEGILQGSAYTYWYIIRGATLHYVNATYIDEEYGMALCLPDSWLDAAVPSRQETEQRLIAVYDTELEYNLLYIKILTAGESAAPYTALGYELLAQSGSFRYYVKGNCSEEDLQFIKDKFMTI